MRLLKRQRLECVTFQIEVILMFLSLYLDNFYPSRVLSDRDWYVTGQCVKV